MTMCKPCSTHADSVCRPKDSGFAARVAASELLSVALIAGLMALGACAARAQSPVPGVFTPPEGCTGWLTVQSRGCRVSNHYKCAADAPGDQWRADFDQEGIFFVSRIDRETQWVESYDMFPTVRQTLDPNPADPASFSELLSAGIDTFDFGLSEDTGNQSRVTGFDKLTGRSTTIDGVDLQETEFEFREVAPDGTVLRSAKGHEYINPDWRIFLSGQSEWMTDEGALPVDGSPKEFIFPGEKGFFTTEPIFDCDATMSQGENDGTILPASVAR
jgi:hypothetical protein